MPDHDAQPLKGGPEETKVEYGCSFCKVKLDVVPFMVRSMNTKHTGQPKRSRVWCGKCDPRETP